MSFASHPPIAATVAHAQHGARDSTAYVTRLGQDTIAIERVITTHDSIYGEVLDRYPRTERFTYAVRLTPAHEVASYTGEFYRGPAPDATVGASLHVDFKGTPHTSPFPVATGRRARPSQCRQAPSR